MPRNFLRDSLIVLAVGVAVYFIYRALIAIPDEYVQQANSVDRMATQQLAKLDGLEQQYDAAKVEDDWDFLSPYATKEDWPSYFAKARKALNEAQAVFDETMAPILDRNTVKELEALQMAIVAGQKNIRLAVKLMQVPAQRRTLILEGRENRDSYFDLAKRLNADAQQRYREFIDVTGDYSRRHTHKADNIESRQATAKSGLNKVKEHFAVMEQEYKSNTADYALYADTHKAIQKSSERLLNYFEEQYTELKQLDRSYVKVLSDQKVDSFITVGRASWCEGEYCGDGDTYTYPAKKVDADTFDYFDSLSADLIAKETDGWGGSNFRKYVPDNRWAALGIDPRQRRNRNYGYAEFWIQSANQKTYHRYTIIEDGEVVEQDWQSVSNDYFWDHYDDLGMAIATKPLGYFESETKTTAEPVGMATIAEPTMVNGVPTGSNQYGEWRHSNGSSFWMYYGMYRMFGDFVGPNRYSYNDWSSYRQYGSKKAYYGRDEEYGTYGSATYSNGRYRNSDFSKRNPKVLAEANTGRSTSVANSIRGAGTAGRGKGPAGGGK